MFTPEQIEQLRAPLDPKHVTERDQGGKTLSYVQGWHVIAEANRIFGFDKWTRETLETRETNRDLVELTGKSGPYKQWRVGYVAKVRIDANGVVREGTGYGSGMGKPEALGDAIESAIKEAETDAMKRALMTFGNPFGLALYDKTQANVAAPDIGRKTPAQAKRDGDDARIKAAIQACGDLEQLGAYGARQLLEEKAKMPPQWQDAIDDMYLLRREELMGRDFREPMGDGGSNGVAGGDRQLEAAH